MMIKSIFQKIYMRIKYKNCKILGKVTLNSILEGGNYIGKNSNFEGEMGYASNVGNNCSLSASIGKYTCIGHNVMTVVATHPLSPFVSIHPAFYTIRKVPYTKFTDEQLFDEFKYVDESRKIGVVIGNDVWIGNNVLIMGGVIIGDGSVIGAGSIVTKDVEPYTINVGVPAKKIKMRFSEENIDYLKKIEWWNKSSDWLKEHAMYFTNIDDFKKNTSQRGDISDNQN